MKCPRCGGDVGIGTTVCARCAAILGQAVAVVALTPPPAGHRPDEDDVTTFAVNRDDLTIVPTTSHLTTLPEPRTKGDDPDATVLTPRGRPRHRR